jgi:hypothetical protein
MTVLRCCGGTVHHDHTVERHGRPFRPNADAERQTRALTVSGGSPLRATAPERLPLTPVPVTDCPWNSTRPAKDPTRGLHTVVSVRTEVRDSSGHNPFALQDLANRFERLFNSAGRKPDLP